LIIIAAPVSGFRKKVPQMPCPKAGTPQPISRWIELLTPGIADRASCRASALASIPASAGIGPAASVALMSAGSQPSRQITTAGRSGIRQAWPLTCRSV
jgi:hypothetical protein